MKIKLFLGFVLVVFLAGGLTAQGDVYWRIGPSYTPVAPMVGDVVTIRGTVSLNHGTQTDILVRGGVDSDTLYTHTIPVLNDGDMVELSFTWTSTRLDHTLWFEIDPDHTLDDSNREGDRWEQVVRPRHRTQPNLRFASSSFSVVPTTFTAGESVTFHYCVMNNGTADAGPFDVGLDVDGTIVQRHHYDGRPASSATCNDFIWVADCGADVKLIADCDNTVVEVNETDNVFDDPRLECDASWHESKNFWLENIRPDTSTTPLTHSTSPTTITADLRYEGTTGSSTYQTKVIMGIVGGGILRTEVFTGLTLPGDATTPVSFSTVLPVGTTRVFFEVDPDRNIAEIDESTADNREEKDIRVIASGKSRVPAIPFSKSTKTEKVPLDYDVKIKNKRELGMAVFPAATEINVKGRVKVTGIPAAAKVKVKAEFFRVKTLGKPIVMTKLIGVSPSSTAHFNFKRRIKGKGKWKVVLSVLASDANPANNKDSAVFRIK